MREKVPDSVKWLDLKHRMITPLLPLSGSKPYFDSLGTYNCLYPAPQALIDEMGVENYKAINNETMWYNGCYHDIYLQGNEIFFQESLYWDTEAKLFDTVPTRWLNPVISASSCMKAER